MITDADKFIQSLYGEMGRLKGTVLYKPQEEFAPDILPIIEQHFVEKGYIFEKRRCMACRDNLIYDLTITLPLTPG
jgi:hypothetical protein